MDAVWLVRGRQLLSRLRFWTAIVGYDPRDQSISQGIYLIYLIIFFSLWGFAVLVFFADWGAGILSLFERIDPNMVAIILTAILLFVGFLLRSYQYSKHSPFIFSDEDAGLICQTPVDRRHVSIAWMLGDWFPTVLPILAVAVVFCYANIQLVEQGSIQWNRLPIYWLKGLQVASVFTPVHLALTAIAYILGGYRLRNDRDNATTRIIPVGLAAVVIILYFTHIDGLQMLLWPVLFPIKSGFGKASWMAGFIVAMTLAAVILWLLFQTSSRLNLSRAAQESRLASHYQLVSWLGDARLNRQMKLRERLGTGHATSRIPGWTGVSALLWKDLVISMRTLTIGQVVAWLVIFGASLGMMIAPNWGVRIGAIIVWAVMVSQRCSERLRVDLELWVISRQLPFRARYLLIADMASAVLGAVTISLFAYGFSCWLGYSPHWLIPGLVPGIVSSIAMMSAMDILRQCKSSDLLAGQVVDLGAGGLVLIFIVSILPLALVWWATSNIEKEQVLWLAALCGILLSYGNSYLMWRLDATLFTKIS